MIRFLLWLARWAWGAESLSIVRARPNECCNDPANLECRRVAPDRFVETCGCGRRHYVMLVDPVEVGLDGKGIG